MSRAVVKVVLKEKALAKSHRPHYILEQIGRGRVLGAGRIGELFVSVSDASVAATAQAIRLHATVDARADVTTIAEIAAVTPSDVLAVPYKSEEFQTGAILTLYDYLSETANSEARGAMRAFLSESQLEVEPTRFGRWVVRRLKREHVRALARLPMMREVSPNSVLHVPSMPASTIGTPVHVQPPNRAKKSYSVVGLLDTGVSSGATALKPWLAGQSNFVVPATPPPSSDFAHGTFIAGLMVQARTMNEDHTEMPPDPVMIHDVRVFSQAERSTVVDVLARISDAVRAAPAVKVWNLSLGQMLPEPDRFSQFARELDSITCKENVLFVVAAGNLRDAPLRPWPPDRWPTGSQDLITPPADSPISLSVGSIAHKDHPHGVTAGSPAPYSRRGPGPAAIAKPEVVHFGGNCGLDLSSGAGVNSICPEGNPTELFGTSFAAPLVASMGAQIWDRLAAGGIEPTPALAKAFLVHSSALRRDFDIDEDTRPFYGFGLPGHVDESLLCESDTFTTVHSVYIPQGQQIHHRFAMPACLTQGGRFRAEIVVTLCYQPLLNEQDGTEYCRSNVSVSLGTMERQADGDLGFVGRLPKEPSAPTEATEKKLIEHGWKWSPLKVYRRQFPRGIAAGQWQLRFEVLYRSGVVAVGPQLAHAIVSVRSFDNSLPVYRDGVRALTRLGHSYSSVSPQVRIRT